MSNTTAADSVIYVSTSIFISATINTNEQIYIRKCVREPVLLGSVPVPVTNQNKIHATKISSNNINRNFVSVTAHEYTPKRDQAIVFNSINWFPHKEYILSIGQIVSPKKKTLHLYLKYLIIVFVYSCRIEPY